MASLLLLASLLFLVFHHAVVDGVPAAAADATAHIDAQQEARVAADVGAPAVADIPVTRGVAAFAKQNLVLMQMTA